MFISRILLFFLFICSFKTYAPVLLQADGTKGTNTFSSKVSAHATDDDPYKSFLYIGQQSATIPANINNNQASYAISVASEGFDDIYPYAPEKVRLNGIADQANPLFGQKISLMGLLQRTPFVVTNDSPTNLYWNVSRVSASPFDVFSVSNIVDATGAVTSGIKAVAGAAVHEDSGTYRIRGNYIFAAVAPNGGIFGALNSGIALIAPGPSQLVQAPAVTGSDLIRSVPLDGTQSFVKVRNNATISATPIDMYYDTTLQRLYIVYQGVAANNGGCRGIVMGYVNQIATPGPGVGSITYTNSLTLTDYAPAAAYINTAQAYVGGVEEGGSGLSYTLTISKFRTLHTSIGYSYGILVGSSNNAVYPANRSVFAIPLVNKSVNPANATWPLDPEHGTLASKIINPGVNATPFFNANDTCLPYYGRGFQTPATTIADLTLQADLQARVGNASAPGVITDMVTFKDTVYVSCLEGATEAAGLFSSQALFDAYGVIKGWTNWQRVTCPINTGSSIYGIGYQPSLGKFFTMEGTTADTIDSVATTTWSSHKNDGFLGGTATDASVGFIELISSQFSASTYGMQGLFDFPANTNGFASAPNRLSCMVFTGYKKIVIAQTGADTAGGIFTPDRGNFSTNMQTSSNGSVTTPGAGACIISVTGGILNDLGAITSAVVVNDGVANAYLVVAGVGGVAVLRPGWTTAGLQKNFSNLPASSFANIGTYKNVRKLLSDGANLYVLTNETLDRISATQLSGAITPTTLATPQSTGFPFSHFSDVVISAKIALLATSQGLFRNANGTDIATNNLAALSWNKLTLGESCESVTRLVPFSTTGLAEDFSGSSAGGGATAGGTVYVLASSVSLGLSSVYRIAVKDTRAGNVIDATTASVIQEYFVQRNTSAFVALGAYRNFFFTNGSLQTDSRSLYENQEAVFEALPAYLRSGTIFYPTRATIPIQADITYSITIGNLLKNSGLGSLILPTNDGMRVLG